MIIFFDTMILIIVFLMILGLAYGILSEIPMVLSAVATAVLIMYWLFKMIFRYLLWGFIIWAIIVAAFFGIFISEYAFHNGYHEVYEVKNEISETDVLPRLEEKTQLSVFKTSYSSDAINYSYVQIRRGKSISIVKLTSAEFAQWRDDCGDNLIFVDNYRFKNTKLEEWNDTFGILELYYCRVWYLLGVMGIVIWVVVHRHSKKYETD